MTLLIIISAIANAFFIFKYYKELKKNQYLNRDVLSLTHHIEVIEDDTELLTGVRTDGNTTRLADHYIQELFKTGSTRVSDHYRTHGADERLMSIVLKRLSIEHPQVKIKTHLGFKQITLV